MPCGNERTWPGTLIGIAYDEINLGRTIVPWGAYANSVYGAVVVLIICLS